MKDEKNPYWYIRLYHPHFGISTASTEFVLFGRGSCDATFLDLTRDGRVSAWFGAPRFVCFKQPQVFNAIPRTRLNPEAGNILF